MLFVCGRRRFRNRFVTFLITLIIFSIISFIIRSDSVLTTITSRKNTKPRLFCVLLNTHSTHGQFVNMSNITWAKHCHKIGIVNYTTSHGIDDALDVHQSPHHVNLWTHILITIRQSISSYEYISNKDTLVIVPAPTFVFREKLSLFLNNSTYNFQSPLIIIHEQNDTNAYILNGEALNLIRNTLLIDSCLQQAYPSARETHLWKCVKHTLQHEQSHIKCEHTNCFIQYYRSQLTLANIKNGFCLQDNLPMCQSVVLLYPITLNDFVTLEFFKYRLKSKSSYDL